MMIYDHDDDHHENHLITLITNFLVGANVERRASWIMASSFIG
jgi:hypothetical protein